MNKIDKVRLIFNILNRHRCMSCNNLNLDINMVLKNTHNYNKYETEKYIQFLIENKNSMDPYHIANKLMKRYYDYPSNMYE